MTQNTSNDTFGARLAQVSKQFECQSQPIPGFEPAETADGKFAHVLGQFDDGSGRSWGFFDETWQWHKVAGGQAEAQAALSEYAAQL